MSLTITIRTADRTPKKNYLGGTVRSLIAGGVLANRIHVFSTSPDTDWIVGQLPECPPVVVYRPVEKRNPNQNGVAQVEALDYQPADWLLMLEDDIRVCADFEGSVLRWLGRHSRPDVHVYRFCAFGGCKFRKPEVSGYPLREQRGSQAIALRADEARDFAKWSTENHTCWRPHRAPFQNQRTNGFDKLVGYWALSRWPEQRIGLVSRPMFVHHIGKQSLLHERTVTNELYFAGERWSYRGASV